MQMQHIQPLQKMVKNIGLLVITSFAFIGCEKKAEQTLPQRNYQITWSDEFTGTNGTSPDAAKWVFDIGRGPSNDGWGNSELQSYTNRASNVALDGNGNLVITARSENFGGAAFTSARIKTKTKLEQKYGRFEARIKTPSGPGIWPAFWMLGADIDTNPWPNCGEIDIMEQRGQEPHIVHGTVHGPGYSGGAAITKSYSLLNGRFDANFHIYAVEWGEDYIDFYVDNFLYQRITPQNVTGKWVYNTPFFLLLNIAVGGNYVGFPTSGTPFPQTMTIDYVRVYKQL
jgi:beta-glucanase (GH16 family)